MLNEKRCFKANAKNSLSDSIAFVEEALKRTGAEKKQLMQTLLLTEEMLVEIISHASPEASIRIQVKNLFGDATVSITAEGDEIDLLSAASIDQIKVDEMGDEEAESSIRSIILKSLEDRLKYAYRKGKNRIRISAGMRGQSMFINTAIALVLGILCGVILNYIAPHAVSDTLCHYLFEPAKTMFMNALKIVIAPVVFFSIVSCISQFKDLSELGRIGAKVMGMYLLTTVFAVAIALTSFLVFKPGTFGFAQSLASMSSDVAVDTNVDTSLLGTIVNIVPSNFLSPFIEADTLQIIFLGVVVGIAVGMIGEYSAILQDFFAACNALFLTITTMIARFIPVAVFCSVLLMVVQLGGESFKALLSIIGTYLVAVFFMICTYGLLILVLGRLNPLVFFKKNREGMLTSFTLSSSSAAMPTNIKTCTDKLGISPKVCHFSIPLGATVNMDGTCMVLVVLGLSLARLYGVTVEPSEIASLGVMIILLSLGAPGVPGSGLVCLGLVLEHIGVPVEAIGLIIGVYPFLDMTNTVSNTTGDVSASLIVARSEGLLDKEKYYSE